MAQTWNHLIFAHWPVPADELRRVLPAPLTLETYDGQAWLGITPFTVSDFRLRALPMMPGFPELNVRTYVTYQGKSGVYFFSLDAGNRLAVLGARISFRLPYFKARMSAVDAADGVHYSSHRTHPNAHPAELRARYRPTGPVYEAARGSLDDWLTSRYCLFAVDKGGKVFRGEIHHPPWPLRPAEATFHRNTMAAPLGIELSGAPLLHLSERQDVLVWPLASAASPD